MIVRHSGPLSSPVIVPVSIACISVSHKSAAKLIGSPSASTGVMPSTRMITRSRTPQRPRRRLASRAARKAPAPWSCRRRSGSDRTVLAACSWSRLGRTFARARRGDTPTVLKSHKDRLNIVQMAHMTLRRRRAHHDPRDLAENLVPSRGRASVRTMREEAPSQRDRDHSDIESDTDPASELASAASPSRSRKRGPTLLGRARGWLAKSQRG